MANNEEAAGPRASVPQKRPCRQSVPPEKCRSSPSGTCSVPRSRIEGLPGLSWVPSQPAFLPLTCQVAEALVVAFSIWVALLDGQAPVAERGGKDGGPVLHQSDADGSVVARSCAVQGGPGRKEAAGSGKARIVSGQRAHRVLPSPQAGSTAEAAILPAPRPVPGTHQPWLSGELTLAPMLIRKSTML